MWEHERLLQRGVQQRAVAEAGRSFPRPEDESAWTLSPATQSGCSNAAAGAQHGDQGPPAPKPDLADYIQGGCRRPDAGARALCTRLLGGLQPGPAAARSGSGRSAELCGHCIASDPRVLREREPALREGGAQRRSPQLAQLPAPAPHRKVDPETHIGDQAVPEETDSARQHRHLPTAAGPTVRRRTSACSRARSVGLQASGEATGGCARLEMEPSREPSGLSTDLPGLELLEVSDEVTEGAPDDGRASAPQRRCFL